VGKAIKTELAGGDVKEAFWCLKGWYRTTTETVSCPCFHTMHCQMTERVELYARRDSPGTPLPFNLLPTPIPDNSPLDHEIRDAARSLLKMQSGGALQMLAEDINIWLGGMLLEEDPKTAEGNKTGGGD
jgi:hypothetical protein